MNFCLKQMRGLDVLERLDLDGIASGRPSPISDCTMNVKYTSDCYCNVNVPIASQREVIRSDRSRREVATKCSSSKADVARSRGNSRKCSGKGLEEELIDSKRSSDGSSTTPMLSPETSNVLENARRMIQDARMQIKKISALPNTRKVRSIAVSYLDDVPIDDADDQLLYVRERILQKFQGDDAQTDENWSTRRNEIFDEGNAHAAAKRIVDLSAPRFRSSARRYEGLPKCGKWTFPTCGRTMEETRFKLSCVNGITVFDGENDVAPGQARSSTHGPQKEETTQRVDFLRVQTGPSVNIERKLVAQNLENFHVSPDPSFVVENLNVGTYQFHYDRREKNKSPIRKEKFVKITDARGDVNNAPKVVFNKQQTKNSKIVGLSKNRTDLKDPNTTQESSLEIIHTETVHAENQNEFKDIDSDKETQEKCESVAQHSSSDVLNMEKNVEEVPTTTSTSTKKIVPDTKINDFAQRTTNLNSKVPKQRSSEQLLHTSNLRNVTEAENINNSADVIQPKISSPQPKVKSLAESVQATTSEVNANDRGDRHFKAKNQYFTDARKMKDPQEKSTVQNYCDYKSWNLELFEISEWLENLGGIDRSVPSMDELDNILISCNKKIDKIVRDARTIERFFLRPEFAKYYSSDDQTSTESIVPLRRTFVPRNSNPIPQHSLNRSTLHKTYKNRPISTNKEVHPKKEELTEIAKAPHSKLSELATKKRDDSKRRICSISKRLGTLIDRAGSGGTEGFPISEWTRNERHGGVKGPCIDSCTKRQSATRSCAVKRLAETEPHLFHVTKVDANVTASSSESSSSIRDSIEQGIKGSASKQVSTLETNIAATKLDCNLENKHLKEALSKKKNLPDFSDRIVNFVLQDEKRNIETKMTAITPAVFKYFLENLQDVAFNANVHDPEPSLPKLIRSFTNKKFQINNDTPNDLSVVPKKHMSSESRVAKFESKESLDKGESIDANNEVENSIPSVESRETITHAKSVDSTEKKLSGRDREDKPQLRHESSGSVADGNRVESESESLKEISSMKTDPSSSKAGTGNNGIQNSASPRTEGNNRESAIAMLKSIINSDENLTSDRSQAARTIAGHVAEEAIENKSTRSVIANTELSADTLPISRNDGKNSKVTDVEIAAESENLLEPNVVRAENKTEVIKVAGSIIHSSRIPTPCDSLQDCTSLKSSSSLRKDERVLLREMEVYNVNTLPLDINKIDRFEVFSKTANDQIKNDTCDKSDAPDVAGNGSTNSRRGSESEDVGILSKQIHVEPKSTYQKLFCSTFNNVSPIERSSKSRGSISETETNKVINNKFHIQTSSDVSYSEGELYMPSSCSYSLGEVRVLKNRDSIADMAGDVNDAIFVTKSMLTSLTNSMDSIAVSTGEI